MTNTKTFAFYAIAALASIAIAFVGMEILLRSISMSSGPGTGRAAERWFKENWKPVNKLGYRDVELDEAPAALPHAIFLGDSFTAGHGVKFDETYYFKTRAALQSKFAFHNLGRNGSSTQRQMRDYAQYRPQLPSPPAVVVHQYFGNDIEDYVTRPVWTAPPLLRFAARYSETAGFLQTYLFARDWGALFADSLFSAYETPQFSEPHMNDVAALHAAFRSEGARLVGVVFPFLNSDEYITRSRPYVAALTHVFDATCVKGDVLMDVTPLAQQLPQADRVVNKMDAHPSPLLHSMVANRITKVLNGDIPNEVGIHPCP